MLTEGEVLPPNPVGDLGPLECSLKTHRQKWEGRRLDPPGAEEMFPGTRMLGDSHLRNTAGGWVLSHLDTVEFHI